MSGSGKTWGEFVATHVCTTDPSGRDSVAAVTLPSGWRTASFLSGRDAGAVTRTVFFRIGSVQAISVKSANWFCTRAAKLVRTSV